MVQINLGNKRYFWSNNKLNMHYKHMVLFDNYTLLKVNPVKITWYPLFQNIKISELSFGAWELCLKLCYGV